MKSAAKTKGEGSLEVFGGRPRWAQSRQHENSTRILHRDDQENGCP